MFCMSQNNILDEDFIYINMTIFVRPSSLIKSKKRMQEYADELGWKMVSQKGTNEEGEVSYDVMIKPKKEKLSPSELSEQQDLIIGFLQEMVNDIYSGYSTEDLPSQLNQITRHIGKYKTKDNKEFVGVNINLVGQALEIFFDLSKGLLLEKEHPKLANKIFHSSLKDWYDKEIEILNKRFGKNKERENSQLITEYFEDAGMKKKEIRKIKRFNFS